MRNLLRNGKKCCRKRTTQNVKLADKDKAIVFLNALPPSYEQLKDALMYGRDKSITFLEVQTALKAKEFQKMSQPQSEAPSEVLNIKKFKKHQIKKSSDKEKKETRSYHHCGKSGHIKKNCFAWKRKQEAEKNDQGSTDVVQAEETHQILNVVEGSANDKWIIDSGCSFHVSSLKEWFQDLRQHLDHYCLGIIKSAQLDALAI